MDEQVLPLFTFDKTITLVRIKPLYNSLCQSDNLLSYASRRGSRSQAKHSTKVTNRCSTDSQGAADNFVRAPYVILGPKVKGKENLREKPLGRLEASPYSMAYLSTFAFCFS
jgi:hypothetical protein